VKITFLDGTAAFTPFRAANQPAGGTVTSLTYVPQALARYGHDVTVVSIWEGEITHNGVNYTRDEAKFLKPDVVVFNRNVINRSALSAFPDSVKVWWLHDIVDPRYLEDDAFKEMDLIVALSGYCRDSYASFYGIPEEKFIVIGNGVDPSTFYDDHRERNRNLAVYASAPIKGGLGLLGYIADNMARNNPDFELHVYASQDLHALDNGPYEKALADLAQHPGVFIFEPVRQFELSEVLRSAWCCLMPNSYPEICSNLMLQAQACGCPVISSPIGANKEMNPSRCTERLPTDLFWYWKEFSDHVALRFLVEGNLPFRRIVPSWEEIGEKWNKALMQLTEENYGNVHLSEVSASV